jgi:excisionase family DNA binding protein
VNDRLLTAREVAGLLGFSTETILRWARQGKLPVVRLPGGAIRFRPDDLDRWLTAHATAGDTRP